MTDGPYIEDRARRDLEKATSFHERYAASLADLRRHLENRRFMIPMPGYDLPPARGSDAFRALKAAWAAIHGPSPAMRSSRRAVGFAAVYERIQREHREKQPRTVRVATEDGQPLWERS